jgi:hypothetical protein
MTSPEHYREAEQLIATARSTAQASTLESTHRYAQTIAEAQVHAMLALTAATAVSSDSGEWRRCRYQAQRLTDGNHAHVGHILACPMSC